jgi:hypothetical protein
MTVGKNQPTKINAHLIGKNQIILKQLILPLIAIVIPLNITVNIVIKMVIQWIAAIRRDAT